MEVGSTVGGRFVVGPAVGRGGMGMVHRATDLERGGEVALKELAGAGLAERGRFEREAAVLARLSHPHVVRYVAHGSDALGPDAPPGSDALGSPWLAMEWLEGRDLASRLADRSLTLRETVELGAAVASALAAAHELGVVHRDVKPGNLFLPDGDPALVKVLDFGIAHLSQTRFGERTLTRPGVLVGTPGYVAPEQVRGLEVDARSDLFALGCVLHACLAGVPPFVGEELMAVLAKILFEPAPRLSELVEIPEELDRLIASMLAKEPAARPASAREVAGRLRAIELGDEADRALVPERRSVLTGLELRYVGIVAAGSSGPAPSEDATWLPERPEELRRALGRVAERQGARLEVLGDGSVIAVLRDAATARDTAWACARLALALRDALPEAPIAASSGRSIVTEDLLVGDAIERAIAALAPAAPGTIRLDVDTAELLGERFEVEPLAAGGALLRGERRGDGGARTVLGRSTPCVGRRRELALLLSTYEECVEEGARAVVILGEPGIGKTRLALEATAAMSEIDPPPLLLRAGGDPVAAGALSIVAAALRVAIGLRDGAPASAMRDALAARLSAIGVADEATAAFLSMALDARDPARSTQAVEAALRDPMLKGEQIAAAALRWLGAECARAPVVLVVDDVQWCDRASVDWIDRALGELASLPLLVLGLARAGADDERASPWASRDRVELRLGRLSRRACVQLARDVLAARTADADALGELVADRADGNAFFLEELVRAAAAGDQALPQSVLGTVEARLARIDPDARRVLRAASVFGPRFRAGGIRALVDPARGGAGEPVHGWLEALAAREILLHVAGEPRSDASEWSFRHALVRDACYAMLTDDDRARGHRRAAEWLAADGDAGSAVLAAHWEAAGELGRAAEASLGTVRRALEGHDLESAAAVALRAARDATPEVRGRLLALRAEALLWLGRSEEAREAAEASLDALAADDLERAHAIAVWVDASGLAGRGDGVDARVAALLASEPATDVDRGRARARWLDAVARVAFGVQMLHLAALADRVLSVATESLARAPIEDAMIEGRLAHARAARAAHAGDLGAAAAGLELAARCYEAVSAERLAAVEQSNLATVYLSLGAYERAEPLLRSALARAERQGASYSAVLARVGLGSALAGLGRLGEAIELTRAALEALAPGSDPRVESSARGSLAEMLLAAGELEQALEAARGAVAAAAELPASRAAALAVLALARIAAGEHADALACVTEGLALAAAHGIEERECDLRLAHALALAAAGRDADARAALDGARALVESRAASIGDPALRASFLTRVAANARVLASSEPPSSEPPATA